MENNNQLTFHELLKNLIKFGFMVGVVSVKVEAKNNQEKYLRLENDLIKKWMVDAENFYPDREVNNWLNRSEYNLEKNKKAEAGYETTLNSCEENKFDDLLFGMFSRKLMLLKLDEISSLYFIKISELIGRIEKKEKGQTYDSDYKVKIKIYVMLKTKSIDKNLIFFSPVISIIAFITPLEKDTATDTFLNFTEAEITNATPAPIYINSNQNSIELKKIMIHEFNDKFSKKNNLDNNYKEIPESEENLPYPKVGNLYSSYFIYLNSYDIFKVLGRNYEMNTLNQNNSNFSDKVVAIKSYIYLLLAGGNDIIEWKISPNQFRYFDDYLKKSFNDLLGIEVECHQGNPGYVEYITTGVYVTITDSESDNKAEFSYGAISSNISIEKFYNTPNEKDRDYRDYNPIWLASYLALIFSLVSVEELIFDDYIKEISKNQERDEKIWLIF